MLIVCLGLLLTAVSACPSLCNCLNNTCTSCVSPLLLLLNSTCVGCPHPCASCFDAYRCSSCRPYYYLMGELCLPCPERCIKCASTCQICEDGFALVEGVCVRCKEPNAVTCDSPDTVVACRGGFWQNGNSCWPCRQFCVVCSSPSNCLQCQAGYEVLVSSGSYCSACAVGCSACQSGICLECLGNYQLVGGSCKDIGSCSVSNCRECSAVNGSIGCRTCWYPYYLEGGACVRGSSLLCVEGAVGPLYLQCQRTCTLTTYALASVTNGVVCQPRLWLNNYNQLYFTASHPLFASFPHIDLVQRLILQNTLTPSLSFSVNLPPYYKLGVLFKVVLLNSAGQTVNISCRLTDSSSVQEGYGLTASVGANYEVVYFNFTTRNIKQQVVRVELWDSAASLALSEMLLQLYPCPSGCRVCYNGELCKQCFAGWFVSTDRRCVSACVGSLELYSGDPANYSSKSCVLECPSQYYAQTYNQSRCLACSSPCNTCLSSSQCMSCLQPLLYYQIEFACLSSCPNTHFAIGEVCSPCNAPCATCLSSTACLSCSIGYLWGGECLSSCLLGYYATSDHLCAACDAKCSSCVGSSSYCLSCREPYLLLESACLSECPSTLYYANGRECVSCGSPCLHCLGAGRCTSCSVGYLMGEECLSTCGEGYYGDSSGKCTPCVNGCQTCLSSSLCLSCGTATNLFGYSCLNDCPAGTFALSSVCSACLAPCSHCVNQSFCLSCSVGYLSRVSLGRCLPSCEDGFYASLADSSCEKCSHGCLNCLPPGSLCRSCLSPLLLQGDSCLSACLLGYYNYSGSCLACTYPCLSCEQTDFKCTSCPASFTLLNHSCITQCPATTFLSQMGCLACQSPCLTCLSSDKCLSCAVDSKTYLWGTSCLSVCPSGSFGDDLTVSCRSCVYPCASCQSETVCSSCLAGYLNPWVGSCEMCSGGLFGNDTNRECSKCSSAVAHCDSCLSALLCTRCEAGYYLLNSTLCLSSAACSNLSGRYLDMPNGACAVCSSPCFTCLNDSYCLSCSLGFFLQGKCLSVCPSSHFQSHSTCLACNWSCLTCTNDSFCSSCNSSSTLPVLLASSGSCIGESDCPKSYYVEGGLGWLQCVKCVLPCSTCSNRTYCIECVSGINYRGSCKSSCPSGYFVSTSNSSQALCLPCSSDCARCMLNSSFCTGCNGSRLLKDNACVSQCGVGYYLDQTVIACFPCRAPCFNCTSAASCTSCANSSFILYFGSCLNSCPDGTYLNASSCWACPSSCLTCRWAQPVPLCVKCGGNRFMSSQSAGVCLQRCKSSEYGDEVSRSCFKCIDPCVSCSSAISCNSCVDGYLLYHSQCLGVDRCPSGSYLSGRSCVQNCSEWWADQSTALCVDHCAPPALKTIVAFTKLCLLACPDNYYISLNYSCLACLSTACDGLLVVNSEVKSIFNVLYVKITFSQSLDLSALSAAQLRVAVRSPLSSGSSQVPFMLTQATKNAVWLQLNLSSSLWQVELVITFSDYYLFAYPLQSLTTSVSVSSFDLYTSEQRAGGEGLQVFAEVCSLVLLGLFGVNLCFNAGHLSYSGIDYLQLLFMVLFLGVDYPPHLNRFLYGFRYSHYLFLPQIFRPTPQQDYSSATPDKFGVVVPDVAFLKNTGSDFIVLLAAVAVLVLCKLVEMVGAWVRGWKDNRVGDEQVQRGQEGWGMRCLKGVVSRVKWNYFNDVVYSLYFSIMLFGFSQLYDLEWRSQLPTDLLSIILAFLFIVLGLALPCLLGYLLNKHEAELIEKSLNREKEEIETKHKQQSDVNIHTEVISSPQAQVDQNSSQVSGKPATQEGEKTEKLMETVEVYEILTAYKCFVSGVKLQVRVGFYHIPLRYLRKLLLAALLVYCSEYPSFVLGVGMMLCLVSLLATVVLKPYRLTFQQVLYPIFDGLYILLFFTICVMQLPQLRLSKEQKLTASYLAIAITLLLCLLLAIHNIVLNMAEAIKYCSGVDHLKKYYQNEYMDSSQAQSQPNKQEHTNSTLRRQQLVVQKDNEENSSEVSGLDIYLKKESTAPQYLIKCIKTDHIEPQQHPNIFEFDHEEPSIRESAQPLHFSQSDNLTQLSHPQLSLQHSHPPLQLVRAQPMEVSEDNN